MSKLDYVIKLDGDQWFCTYSDFVNLQESDVAFGRTPHEALQNFISQRVEANRE